MRVSPAARAGLAAALLCLAMLALFWPGIAMFDSLVQYRQILAGSYDDWHPPAMARLWSLFQGWWDGQAPMFLLQMLLYWLGLGLFAAALARAGAWRASIGVLLLGAWPPFAGWQAGVIKDAQLAGALLAAVGMGGWWRLADRPIPRWGAAMIVLLLVYATLVRINAVFATVPLAFGLFGRSAWRAPLRRGAVMLVAMVAVLAVSPLVNHRLLGAEASDVGNSLLVYDLAGIAHHAGPEAVPALPVAAWRKAEAQRCITPVQWDPLGNRCSFVADGLVAAEPGRQLAITWAATIARHPLAYAGHRLSHWNATMRWLLPRHFPSAEPPAASEENDLGLVSPAPRIGAFQHLAGTLAESPIGTPMLWFVAALGVLALAWRGNDSRSRLAVTLALSAVLTELAFLVVSVASDYRYHLWAMLATGLALSLALRVEVPRRGPRVLLAALVLVAASSLAARIVLPPFETYTDAAG